jgi:chromosome partitioning protein
MHVAVALMNCGHRVATVDLDSRQKSFTHYIENRRSWSICAGLGLMLPTHFCIARGSTVRLDDNEAIEFSGFVEALESVEETHDFIIVDTPGTDSYLMRLAHAMADTLITPLNDSFVDFDVLAKVDPMTFAVMELSPYAAMVRETRRNRGIIDGAWLDWIVVRNRVPAIGTRNKRQVGECLRELGTRLSFRSAEGFGERVVYRELFPRGLTALDSLDERTLGTRPTFSHMNAQEEVMDLVRMLKLPVGHRGRGLAAARGEGLMAYRTTADMHLGQR